MVIVADMQYLKWYSKKKCNCIMPAGSPTFVKSVGHHTTEVTSSLWPWSVMGGYLGSEIWKANILNQRNDTQVLVLNQKTECTFQIYV